MTDKTNEIQTIRKAWILFQMAVDMMDGYRVGGTSGFLSRRAVARMRIHDKWLTCTGEFFCTCSPSTG